MSTSEIPAFFRVRQSFERPRVTHPAREVRAELQRVFPGEAIAAGAEIGVTVGSRGISGIAAITRAAVDFLRERRARPYNIPARASPAGPSDSAQARLIAHFGVTEETMGCPVRAGMPTRSLGRTADGVEIRLAEVAWESGGILLVNRIKPHTDFKAPLESGLAKIGAIGLGKLEGAREIHRHLFTLGLANAIRSVAQSLLATGKILGGLAILENAYHETAKIVGVPRAGLFATEERLLEEARRLMGRLPLDEIDVLVCDRLGKNISGAGLDTNITGRSVYGYTPGTPWCKGMPSITRIAVMDVSDESDGNAVGMGLVDFVPERFLSRVDRRVTSLNSITACAPAGAKTPVALPDDREAILAAIRTSAIRAEGPRVVYARDTLALEHVLVSEACLPLLAERADLELASRPESLTFDERGRLRSAFV
jgi:hypothetical protein